MKYNTIFKIGDRVEGGKITSNLKFDRRMMLKERGVITNLKIDKEDDSPLDYGTYYEILLDGYRHYTTRFVYDTFNDKRSGENHRKSPIHLEDYLETIINEIKQEIK